MGKSAATVREQRICGRELHPAVEAVFGDLRGRLEGDLLAVCHTAGGSVCTVEEGGVLRRWNPRNGHQLESFALSELDACWAFSPDGRRVVSGGVSLSVWGVSSGRLLGEHNEPDWITAIAFSPDGGAIATGHQDHRVRLWDVRTGKLLQTLSRHRDEVCALAFNRDGTKLATAGEDRLAFLWDLESGRCAQTLDGHTDRIDALAWSRSGERLASAAWDTSVRIWDTDSGQLLAMLNGQGECVHTVTFHQDDRTLICGDSDCVVRLWDWEALTVLAELRGHEGAVKHIALSRDGSLLATGGADRCVRFWDLTTGRAVVEPARPLTEIHAVRVSGQGDVVAASRAGGLILWEGGDHLRGREVPAPEPVTALAGRESGSWAVGLEDGRICAYPDLFRSEPVVWRAHETTVRRLCLSPDGARLASTGGADGAVKLWDSRTGEPLLIIPEAVEKRPVESIAFHPRLPLLAAGGIEWTASSNSEGVIAVWDLSTYERRALLEGGASDLAVSPDGALLASVSLYRSVVLWDLSTGEMLRELEDEGSRITAIEFDRAGRYFAVASDDVGVRIWHAESWRLLATFDLETHVKDLVFTPDGRALVTGNGNATCYRLSLENLSLYS